MKLSFSWLRVRFWEFRMGHSSYLVFLMSLFNFILIAYRLLVEQIPFLNVIFPNLTMFAVVLIIIYIPTTILVGHWHRKTQLPTESNISFLASPLIASMFKLQFQILNGTADKKQVDDMIELLKSIEVGYE